MYIHLLTVSTTRYTSSAVGSLNDAELTFTTNPSCSSSTFQVTYQQCLGAGCTRTDFTYTDAMTLSTTGTTLSVSGLVAGNTYCYRTTLTVAGTIVGMDDGMFQTSLPVPQQSLNSGAARLVSTDPSVVYECVNSVEGFNGNSRQIEATYNQITIVGMDDGMFQTSLPVPQQSLNSGAARLVSTDPSVVYECVNSVEGFNGNSRQIEATYNQITGVFAVPKCSGRF